MRMNALIFASLLLAINVFAEDKNSSLGDFERSLMDHSTSNSSFEQSLMQTSSEMEPIYRTRDDLLEAIRNKDTAMVSLKVAQLEGMHTPSIISIHDIEKLCFYKDLKMYRALLKMLVRHYKDFYDFKNPNAAYAENDGLMIYTKEYLGNHSLEKQDYDENRLDIKKSDLTDAEKSELELLMNLRFAYKNNLESERVRVLAETFVKNNPDHPDAPWVQKSILAPLTRMDMREMYSAERATKKESVIQNKLYTGGFGLNLYFVGGGFGYSDYYREDVVKPESYPVNVELYLQIRRVAAALSLVNSGHEGVMNLGASLGFVAYDSRYLKVRPFVGFNGCIFNGYVTNTHYNLSSDDYFHVVYSGSKDNDSYESSNLGTSFTVGANVDFKFATSYFLLSKSKLTSFAIVSKFGLSYMNLEADAPITRGSGFDAFFAIGLGVYFW